MPLHRGRIYLWASWTLTTFTSNGQRGHPATHLSWSPAIRVEECLVFSFSVISHLSFSCALTRDYFPILNPHTLGSKTQNFTFQLDMKFYLSLYFTFLSEPWPLELELDSYFMAKRDFVKRRVAFITETHPGQMPSGNWLQCRCPKGNY